MKLSKKIISVLVATVMLCLMMPSVLSSASGITAEDFFTYEITDGKATITGYRAEYLKEYLDSNSGYILYIPPYIDIYEVERIGNGALGGITASASSYGVMDIIVGDGIKTIATEAFSECNIRNINIPGSVTLIENDAFRDSCMESITFLYQGTSEKLNTQGDPFTVAELNNVLFYGSFYEWSDYYCPDTYATSISLDKLYFMYGDIDYNTTYSDGMLYQVTTYYDTALNETCYAVNVFGFKTDRIPETIDGFTVTGIGVERNSPYFLFGDLLYGGEGSKELIIPKSVVKINDGAFLLHDIGYKTLTDISYYGTEEEWNSIAVGTDNEFLTGVDVHFNYFEHEHTFVSSVEAATCVQSGQKYDLCSVCNEKYHSTVVPPTGNHICEDWTVTLKPTTQSEGEKESVCSVCHSTVTEKIPKLEISELQPTVNDNSALDVDTEKSLVSGFDLTKGVDEAVEQALALSDGTHIAYENVSAPRTGDKIEIRADETDDFICSYTVVVFGDTNGDGKYDGADATVASLIAEDMLVLDEAAMTAADCNHDGVVDQIDVDLLNRAGILLSKVDQTKTAEELQTDSAYIEYLSIIDQSADTDKTENLQTEKEFVRIFFTEIWKYIKAILSIID